MSSRMNIIISSLCDFLVVSSMGASMLIVSEFLLRVAFILFCVCFWSRSIGEGTSPGAGMGTGAGMGCSITFPGTGTRTGICTLEL